MLLDAIITVLRETLEAGVLISVLISFSKRESLPLVWILPGIIFGIMGATSYAMNINNISEWFEYSGQEIIGATLQYSVAILVTALMLFSKSKHSLLATILLSSIFGIALIREGAEIMILFSVFWQHQNIASSGALSGFIGLTIGLSVGVVSYYLLSLLPKNSLPYFHLVLLALLSSGMSLQATQLLMQADWLEQGNILWNSNWLLSESSVTGQAAYAIFGYESTPSLAEASTYGATFSLILTLGYLFNIRKRTARASE